MLMLPPYDQPEQYPVWDLTVAFGGAEYRLIYTYRERQDRWYLDVFDTAGAALGRGMKLVHGCPMIHRLMCVDTAGDTSPGYEDLGRRHRVVYLEPEDNPAPADDYDITIEVTP